MGDIRVLVIDDEEFIRDLIVDFLDLEEISCKSVSGSEEAAEFLEHNSSDLILLDRNLGNQRAEDIVLKLRGISSCPIVLMTGDHRCSDDFLKEFGIDGVIYKPFQVDEFLGAVKGFLEK